MAARSETQHASQAARSAADVADSGVAVVHHDMRIAPGYVHAIHPDHGEPVTYTPGQLMPPWLLEELAAGGRLVPESDGVWQLEPATKGSKR